jgi:hypothetical protein
MKKGILFIMSVILSISLQAQKDTTAIASSRVKQGLSSKAPDVSISIYPVPVRENYFNIKTDREVSFVKITNIIGQDIYRAQYNNPQTLNKIILDNPGRGMYLVTIVFSDGVRVVKKIMIEETE